jgi:reactive intermediate/imine deaminase
MKIDSARFGSLEVSPERILEFPAGLPGFEALRRYSVHHPEGGEPNYFILQSLEDPLVAFHIADPARFGYDYRLSLSDAEAAAIDLRAPEEACIAVMLFKEGEGGAALRASLLAPLVINLRSRLALQHPLSRQEVVLATAPGRQAIATAAAPAAIGTYSQAVRAGDTVYLSGQIGLDPATQQLAEGIEAQIAQVFANLAAVAAAAGADLAQAVKVNIYLTDLGHFARVNEAMARHFVQPYPARATVGVAALPRGALVEADAVIVVG